MSDSKYVPSESGPDICEAVRRFGATRHLRSAVRMRAPQMGDCMSSQSTEKLPVLDEDAIIDLERGLPGGDLSPALQTFGEELGRRLVTLEELSATQDHSGLASLAHGLKGSASTFHAPGLASAASTLEEELKAPGPEGIHTATTQLSAELRRVVRHLQDLLERRKKERK